MGKRKLTALNPRALAILWAFRLRCEGLLTPDRHDAWAAREQAGTSTDELLADLGEIDPATALDIAAEIGVNAEGGNA